MKVGDVSMMRFLVPAFLGICFAVCLAEEPPKPAPPTPEAVEFAKKIADALRSAKVVTYKAKYTPSGWVSQRVPSVEGSATVGDQSKHKIDSFAVQVKMQKAGSEDVIEMAAGSDGNEYFLIDSKAKVCYKDLDSAVLGSQGRNVQRIVLRDFAALDPLADVLKGGEIELKGDVKVGEEECREIFMKFPDTGAMTWAVSKKDFLPRKVTRHIKGEEGEATTELVISDLVVNPQFVRNPFEMICPQGFKQTDEFAP